MTDAPPPQNGGPAASSGGLWRRYRSMPLWVQILVPVVIAVIVVGLVVWATADSDNTDSTDSTDTTGGDDTNLDEVLRGIIVVGGIRELGDTTTTDAAATETSPATAPPTDAPATTEGAVATTGTPATSEAPATSDAPAPTDAPVTTDAPAATDAPVDTDAEATTEAPESTEAPPTTPSPATEFPTTAQFIDRWNDATEGTNVPTITAAQATELTGDYAGYHLITLSPVNGSGSPPQVGVVGTLTSPGSGQLSEVLLVWIPGADEDSSEFYWESFGVLTQAISPDITAAETAALEASLGRVPDQPPFTSSAAASSHGFDYERSARPYDGDDGTIDVSAIAVT